MIWCDSILAAAATAFQADGDMMALVPGKLWHRRSPSEQEGLERPYAIATVTAVKDKEFISDTSYVQSFILTITIYGDDTTDNTGKMAGYLGKWDFDSTLFYQVPAHVLNVCPSAEDIDLDQQEKEGKDVVIASKQWTITLHCSSQTTP